MKKFGTFREFYPFYLSEHSDVRNRRMHFLGSWLVLAVIAWSILSQNWLLLLLAPVAGYGCAWLGHALFERNKPATFTYPAYSLIGDWVMFVDILRGRVKL